MPPPSITWYKDAALVEVEKLARFKQRSDGSLQISGLLPDDTGMLQCFAHNAAGEAQTSTYLAVTSKSPPCAAPELLHEAQCPSPLLRSTVGRDRTMVGAYPLWHQLVGSFQHYILPEEREPCFLVTIFRGPRVPDALGEEPVPFAVSRHRSPPGSWTPSTNAALNFAFLDKLLRVHWRSSPTDFVTEGVSRPLGSQFPLSGGLRFKKAELS